MESEQKLRGRFLQVVLWLGVVVFGFFSANYLYQQIWIMGILEGIGVVMLFVAMIWLKKGYYLGPAILGWLGLYGVMLALLVYGGVGGTGIIWWGLMPLIGYVLFGIKGGDISWGIISLTLAGAWISSLVGMELFYFESLFIRQMLIMMIVEGVIVRVFEKTAEEIRDLARSQTKQLAEEIEMKKKIESSLREKVELLEKEQQKSVNVRAAMLNLLEDERELQTELKQEKLGVERKVAERTRELMAVINSISRGLLVINQEKQVLLENVVLRKMLRIGEDKPISCQIMRNYLGKEIDLLEIVGQVFSKKKEMLLEPKLIGNRYIVIQIVPIGENGQVSEVVIFLKDVTESINLQRSRDEFISIASHELRTPLTAIRGNAEMIMEQYGSKIKNKDVSEMLSDIHEGSVRLIGIVNDFLNVSRLEMGRLEFKIEEKEVETEIIEVIKEFEVTGSRQKILIEWIKPGCKLPRVAVDVDRLKQVLINLIGNGLKFTKAGKISLMANVEKDYVCVAVTDTGEGISPERQNLLFHKFQQAGSNLYTRDTSKGTGLGLYISRLIMEGMKGKIELAKSEVGKGSTFTLWLPIAKNTRVKHS